MKNLNNYIQVKAPNVIIQIKTNNNSVMVKGQNEEGYVDKSIMLDDLDLSTKLSDLIEGMKIHQRQQLVDFCGDSAPALDAFDTDMQALEDSIDAFLETDEEPVN